MEVLVTGGAGYIGSHTAVELALAGHQVIIADNYSNSSPSVIKRLRTLMKQDIPVYAIDVADRRRLEDVFANHHISAVIHCAGFKSVAESAQKPLLYYRNNLDTTLSILETMSEYNCGIFIFSSSATVYGDQDDTVYTEEMSAGCATTTYGRTKQMIEAIACDLSLSAPEFSIVLLRYFNPIGAHPSGLIGEMPCKEPNNIFPRLLEAASGERPFLPVYGDDYPTSDGTGVRDYLHICDLACGHVRAMEYARDKRGVSVFNLGTGSPVSVKQLIDTFERVCGVKVPYQIFPRRTGDLAQFSADPAKAQEVLGWRAKRTLEEMCKDGWQWQLCRMSDR